MTQQLTQRTSRQTRRAALVLAALLPLAAIGCNNAGEGALSGAALGALGGLAIGSLSGDAGKGAAAGAVIGGVGGAVIGDQNDRNRRNSSRSNNRYGADY